MTKDSRPAANSAEGRERGGFPQRVLVVGGSRGIGRATVARLAADGVQCAIAYASDDTAARATADLAGRVGPRPAVVKGDIAQHGAMLVTAAEAEIGPLAGLVVTANVQSLGRTLDTTYEAQRRAFDVQVWGLLDVVRAATESLAAAQGAVVAVSGITSDHYAKFYGPVGPPKGALDTMVRYLAAELGPRQIRVNAVSPCLVENPEDRPEEVEPFWEPVRRRTPMRRLATPEDIAASIVALLGPDLGFVTGQILVVDGGYTLLS